MIQCQFFHQFQTNPEPDLEVVVCSGYGKNGALSVLQVWVLLQTLPPVYSWSCKHGWQLHVLHVRSRNAQHSVLRRWGSSAAGLCGCYSDVWALPGLPQRWLERPLKHPRYSRGTLLMHCSCISHRMHETSVICQVLSANAFIMRPHLHLVLTCISSGLISNVS